MVLTRSQAAKQKAHQSPEAHRPSKHAATADAQPGGGTAQPSQPLADKLLNVHSGMGSKASKLSRLRTGPCSHPITSLPGSPAVSPGPGTREFTIAAVQQQAQQAELGQALAAVAAAQAGAGATEGEQQPAAEASSVEKRQPEGEEAAAGGLQAAAIGEQATASDPAAPVGMPAEHPAAPQQQAQPPAPQPVCGVLGCEPACPAACLPTWLALNAAVCWSPLLCLTAVTPIPFQPHGHPPAHPAAAREAAQAAAGQGGAVRQAARRPRACGGGCRVCGQPGPAGAAAWPASRCGCCALCGSRLMAAAGRTCVGWLARGLTSTTLPAA